VVKEVNYLLKIKFLHETQPERGVLKYMGRNFDTLISPPVWQHLSKNRIRDFCPVGVLNCPSGDRIRDFCPAGVLNCPSGDRIRDFYPVRGLNCPSGTENTGIVP